MQRQPIQHTAVRPSTKPLTAKRGPGRPPGTGTPTPVPRSIAPTTTDADQAAALVLELAVRWQRGEVLDAILGQAIRNYVQAKTGKRRPI